MTRHALAVDIGGTFTDVVLVSHDGASFVDKTLTTHNNLLEGFFRGVDLVLDHAGLQPGDVDDVIVHATTVVTNALIERKGPPTALIVTEGFRDVLYIRNEHRYDMYDPQIEFADPLITRELTFPLAERTYADGGIGAAIDEDAVRAISKELKAKGVQSVAVCLLNSYKNPENEQVVGRVLAEELPDLFVSLSSDIAPQMREYLRSSTTAINAFTQPITRPYLNALTEELSNRGFSQLPLIMLSSGGVVGAPTAGRNPVRMIESGPAAGALVASYFARRFDIPNLISFDMGGTTAKACLILEYEPLVTGEFEVDRRYRFKPGSGMPITVPSIDMIEIGAGGGSIARVDALGLLKTGPDSAGSDPGPVCYGRGGTQPCITDADVVLGILDPDNFLGGDMKLDADGARAALGALGDKLGVSAEKAALGVFEVVCEQMAAAARAHATDRGVDYRGLPMLAFGGAGPVHACKVAELVDASMVIYPPLASVLSAFGTLVTPAKIDLVRSALARLGDIDWSALGATLDTMIEEGRSALLEAGLDVAQARFGFAADMRYVGQQSEITVQFEDDPRKIADPATLRESFETAYEKVYGLKLSDMSVEVVSWRVVAQGKPPAREATIAFATEPAAPKRTRPVHLADTPVDVPVYDRSAIAIGQTIAGPVIIEERETTAFVLPGWSVVLHENGSLIARRKEA
ncbi:hydantoinase/oxoprolinase family protein [Microbaculum marinisediminis]|uniref:Hydantoinase/oxoprolinase family protein n=1 Tax=Microbaculum marinisediminis TaxID=2931392 RepID=A0AAW5R5K4_9HYPH|nr:hydantoinase/oxoprolinase family protein [Microbaculum sp. A6E488]MCT8973966.1 hydantoinase/oxoprolinase family protein [Microbaculum sp. A6E488]